eukprot:7112425-Pyramimonas_sp.AAC.1
MQTAGRCPYRWGAAQTNGGNNPAVVPRSPSSALSQAPPRICPTGPPQRAPPRRARGAGAA